jgi:hypothetical protein
MAGSQQFERADYAVCTDQFGLFQLARQQQVDEITAWDRNAHASSVGLCVVPWWHHAMPAKKEKPSRPPFSRSQCLHPVSSHA